MAIVRSNFDIQYHQPVGFLIEGTSQNDTLFGTSYADYIYGYGGSDVLNGGSGNDFLFGHEGNDKLYGGTGNDTLDGGTGDDVLNGGLGADALNGGSGMDGVAYTNAAAGVMLDLATGGVTNEASGDTYSDIENVFGSVYADIINGDGKANVIHGYVGDDYLFGQSGDDRIFGDQGNDTLRGGHGHDLLNGGEGNDRLTGDETGFVYADTFVLQPGYGVDTITDFQVGVDHLDLRAYGITHLGGDGQLANGPTSNVTWYSGGLDLNEQLVFDYFDNTLYRVTVREDAYDYQNVYVASATPIVRLTGVTSLSGDDLILATASSGMMG